MVCSGRTKNNTTNVVIQQNSRKLLMMDILMFETCWARKKWNKIASDIKLVFYSSTITMMHGPINISWGSVWAETQRIHGNLDLGRALRVVSKWAFLCIESRAVALHQHTEHLLLTVPVPSCVETYDTALTHFHRLSSPTHAFDALFRVSVTVTSSNNLV